MCDLETLATDGFIIHLTNPLNELFEVQSASSNSATTTNIHASGAMHNMVTAASSRARAIDDGDSGDAEISKFLSRKVKIHSQSWAVGADFAATISPWDLILNNAAVLDKLANYYLLKADLKLTFMINGTPFHAGMLLASYSYMDVQNFDVTIGGDTQLVTLSQRPHIWINASTNKSGCICAPFFAPTNYLCIGDSTISAADLATVHIYSAQSLKQINAGTDTVTVSVFAELLNVKLTAPTQRIVTISQPSPLIENEFKFTFECQSGTEDEYSEKDGIISKPASAIADIAGRLTDAPYIGPFALATKIGATAIGGIARLFGFSKPTQLADVSPMRNMPVSSLALTEGADMSQKLTATGKQEITVDPSTVGFSGEDELTICAFAQRETYLTKFDWKVSAAQDDYIFAIDVDPMAERRIAVTGGHKIIPTSLSFISRVFSEWSGSLEYRFQVIASQYHRGRIAIIFDPYGPSGTNPYNVTFNTILDLEDARDITVKVKWQNDRPYLICDSLDMTRTFYTTTTPETRTVDRDASNGVIYVQVVNELVSPDAVTDATLLVSVKASDDFELMNPRGDALNTFIYPIVTISGDSNLLDKEFTFEVQSSTEIVPPSENQPVSTSAMDVTTDVSINTDEKALIFYGERITSARQLLKRYSLWRTIGAFDNGTADLTKQSFCMRQMPTSGGYDTTAVDVTSTAIPYWYNSQTYINYFKNYFAGWRGSVRYKFTPNSSLKNINVQRFTGTAGRSHVASYRPFRTTKIIAAQSTSVSAYQGLLEQNYATAGGALTQCRSQDALEVEIPYHLPVRFSKTQGEFNTAGSNTLANGYPGGDSFWLNMYTNDNGDIIANVASYVAAGEDFTLFGVVGAPVMYYTSTIPSA